MRAVVLGLVLVAAGLARVDARSTVVEFREELIEAVGDRTDRAAVVRVVRTVRDYARRDPRNLVQFARLANRVLNDRVADNLRGRAAFLLLAGTARDFLPLEGTGGNRFLRFIRLVVRKLPNSQKTLQVSARIVDRLVEINVNRGGSREDDQTLRDAVFVSFTVPCFCSF